LHRKSKCETTSGRDEPLLGRKQHLGGKKKNYRVWYKQENQKNKKTKLSEGRWGIDTFGGPYDTELNLCQQREQKKTVTGGTIRNRSGGGRKKSIIVSTGNTHGREKPRNLGRCKGGGVRQRYQEASRSNPQGGAPLK